MATDFNFEHLQVIEEPFLHFVAPEFMDETLADELLTWFERDATWVKKKIEKFYESYDLSLRHSVLPPSLRFLTDDGFLSPVKQRVSEAMNAPLGRGIDVTAHHLMPGQSIKIHSDFGEVKQTHRLLIQLNRGWTLENGGLLMFVTSERPEAPSEKDCYYLPEHRTAFCFEVSQKSLHAVSRVITGDRYTLCLSFYGERD